MWYRWLREGGSTSGGSIGTITRSLVCKISDRVAGKEISGHALLVNYYLLVYSLKVIRRALVCGSLATRKDTLYHIF